MCFVYTETNFKDVTITIQRYLTMLKAISACTVNWSKVGLKLKYAVQLYSTIWSRVRRRKCFVLWEIPVEEIVLFVSFCCCCCCCCSFILQQLDPYPVPIFFIRKGIWEGKLAHTKAFGKEAEKVTSLRFVLFSHDASWTHAWIG